MFIFLLSIPSSRPINSTFIIIEAIVFSEHQRASQINCCRWSETDHCLWTPDTSRMWGREDNRRGMVIIGSLPLPRFVCALYHRWWIVPSSKWVLRWALLIFASPFDRFNKHCWALVKWPLDDCIVQDSMCFTMSHQITKVKGKL